MQTEIAERIYQAALSCGFDNCGIISVNALDGFGALFMERKKKIPSGEAFYSNIDDLGKTKERFPWAKSVIICSYWYGKYRYPKEFQGRYAKDFFLKPQDHPQTGYDHLAFEAWLEGQGFRFAGGEQYQHLSVAPLRYAAVMAGMGIFRRNNFFYTEKGSHNRLVGYVIDQECELIHHTQLKPCSETCDLCQKACKTKALCGPFALDPLKCVSFLTTFGQGIIPPDLNADMLEEWICGCDNCQDAYPYNHRKNWSEGESFSDLDELAEELLPEKILTQSDEYLIEHIISKTDRHMKPSDASVLRCNVKRAIQFKNKK